jgi:hypothetical protein
MKAAILITLVFCIGCGATKPQPDHFHAIKDALKNEHVTEPGRDWYMHLDTDTNAVKWIVHLLREDVIAEPDRAAERALTIQKREKQEKEHPDPFFGTEVDTAQSISLYHFEKKLAFYEDRLAILRQASNSIIR